jgi:hypothetical protein
MSWMNWKSWMTRSLAAQQENVGLQPLLLRFAPEDALVDMLSDPETKQLFAGFPSS